MSKLKKTFLNIWKDESGQGATEYILILVVVAVMVLVFKDELKKMIADRTKDMSAKVGTFMNQIN